MVEYYIYKMDDYFVLKIGDKEFSSQSLDVILKKLEEIREENHKKH